MGAPQDLFAATTLGTGLVWALVRGEDDWATCEFDDGAFEAMLLWPDEAGAQACAGGEWEGFRPAAIALAEYVQSWLPAMKEDGLRVNINYGPRSHGTVLTPGELVDAYRRILVAREGGGN